DHGRQEVTGKRHHRLTVEAHHLDLAALICRHQVAKAAKAGVVDQVLDFDAEAVDGSAELGRAAGAGQVHRHATDLYAVRAGELIGELAELPFRARAHHQVATTTRQLASKLGAETGGCSGHHRPFIVEAIRHGFARAESTPLHGRGWAE